MRDPRQAHECAACFQASGPDGNVEGSRLRGVLVAAADGAVERAGQQQMALDGLEGLAFRRDAGGTLDARLEHAASRLRLFNCRSQARSGGV